MAPCSFCSFPLFSVLFLPVPFFYLFVLSILFVLLTFLFFKPFSVLFVLFPFSSFSKETCIVYTHFFVDYVKKNVCRLILLYEIVERERQLLSSSTRRLTWMVERTSYTSSVLQIRFPDS